MNNPRIRCWLWWGPQLNERDGGAIVSYYQLDKLNQLQPRDEHWAIPYVIIILQKHRVYPNPHASP